MSINRCTVFLGCLLLAASACSFSFTTANISSVILSRDKTGSPEATTFASTDTFYGIVTIANSISKTSVKAHVLVEDVPGQAVGPITGLGSTVDLDASGSATFTFSPPTAGWPAGKYKFDVVMLDEGGVQKDQKTVIFTIS